MGLPDKRIYRERERETAIKLDAHNRQQELFVETTVSQFPVELSLHDWASVAECPASLSHFTFQDNQL